MRAAEKQPPIQTTFHRSYRVSKTSPKKKNVHQDNLKWYELHNRDLSGGVAHEQSEKERYREVHEHMVNGVLSEAPEKEVTDNVMFVSPLQVQEPEKRGAVSQELARSTKFKEAVNTLKKYDQTDRWAAGLNANTLMTEYRRKVLFHALLDSGDVDEKREDAQEKVKRFLHINFPNEMSEEDKEHMEMEKEKLLKMEKAMKRKIKPKRVKAEETDFHPQYGDYDVMRNRWSYLRPQLTNCIDRKDLIPSTTSKISNANGGVTVKGNVEDILRFERLQREIEDKAMKKMEMSRSSMSTTTMSPRRGGRSVKK